MNFQKTVVFIGYKEMTLKDGTVLYSITFYVDDDTVTVNVLRTNIEVASAVMSLEFGDKCLATFTLRKTDKLYKLGLSALTNV